MSPIPIQEQECLLRFARSVIENHLKAAPQYPEDIAISPALKEKRGCFVTLHLNGQLRGCIGTIEPVMPLWTCVQENAVHAAFHDPRFSPVTPEELTDIVIEISVLSPPRTLVFQNADMLLSLLEPGVHGVILSRGHRRATFLPQVWEQLPRPENFLSHLCLKAGMTASCWKDSDITVEVYEVLYFSEESVREPEGAVVRPK